MKKLFVAMAAVLASMSMSAQQNISFREGKLVSPQVNSDKTVTFRLKAPKAKSVKVLADWEQNNGQGTLKKGKDACGSIPPLSSLQRCSHIVSTLTAW